MKKLLSLVLAMCLCLSLLPAANAANGEKVGKTVLNVAFSQSASNPEAQALYKLSDDLYDATSGRYSLEVYPDASLGNQQQTLQMVSMGDLDMAVVGNAYIEVYASDFSLFSAPYLFGSFKQLENSLKSNAAALQDLYSVTNASDFYVLSSYCTGARNLYTRDGPVISPADFSGLKIRVRDTVESINMIQNMGGTPIIMAMSDVYSALCTKVIDGAEYQLSSYVDLLQYEPAPYYNYTEHIYIPDHLVVSKATFNEMSREDQAVLRNLCLDSIQYCFQLSREMNDSYEEKAREHGVTFSYPDRAAFKALCSEQTQAAASQGAVTQAMYNLIQSMPTDSDVGINYFPVPSPAPTLTRGWVKQNGSWYYYGDNGDPYQEQWLKSGGKWYYFDSEGKMVTNTWISDKGKQFYFNAGGVMQSSKWLQLGDDWYYLNSGGDRKENAWLKSGGKWYYFGEDGRMVTGQMEISGKLYVFSASGVMQANKWIQSGSDWYYLNGSGALSTGWQKVGSTWYYFDPSGIMLTGKQQIDGEVYFFNASGAMQAGKWYQDGADWYYLASSGAAYRSKWLKSGGKWYWFDEGGLMLSDTSREISGKVYNFNASGACTNP